jgi:hypothetical protein
MVSYAQLEDETWWDREIVTAELDWLGDALCAHYGRPRSAAGAKGDNGHLRGAHRSQEWILSSAFCTSRTATVQSGLTSDQLRHVAGHDFTPGVWGTDANRQLMVVHTRRLLYAAKAGRLKGVREFAGTLDARNPFGWNVARGAEVSFDASHVEHSHLTLDRRMLRDRSVVENIFKIMIGEDDMNEAQAQELHNLHETVKWEIRNWTAGTLQAVGRLEAAVAEEKTRDAATATAITALAELVKAGGGDPDTAAILARIDASGAAVRADVEQRHQAEMTELGRVHADVLRDRDAQIAALTAELDRLGATPAA